MNTKGILIDALQRAGDRTLRGQLESLTVAQLRNRFIRVTGYDPATIDMDTLEQLTPEELQGDAEDDESEGEGEGEGDEQEQDDEAEEESEDEPLPPAESSHNLLPKLIALVNQRRPDGQRWNVYLYGAPGGGKTTACKQVAEHLGLDFGYISLLPQSPRSDVTGFIDAGGVFRDTVFHRLYTNGGVFLFDELDNASDSLLTSLNAALENGQASFPDGLHDRHENFIAVGAGNTAARGGERNHAGRRALDGATIERFVFLEWGYDEQLESKLCQQINPKTGPVWCDWVQQVRGYCRTAHPHVIASPRASMYAAQLAETGVFQPREIADAVLFKGLGKDVVENVIKNVALPKPKRKPVMRGKPLNVHHEVPA